MPVILIGINLLWPAGPIKPSPGLVYEAESSYNYIQVTQFDDERGGRWRFLHLNEGQGIHSAYNPNYYDYPLVDGVWDYFLLAPYFNKPPHTQADVGSLLLIGSAAGTIPKAYSHIYGPIPIDGVEIDPGIIEAGRLWFDMNEPNLTVHAQDGRFFLATTPNAYDVIAVDAYRPPYIPFHLTTREFFQEIYDHLNDEGVMAINAGRTATDYSLVAALGTTMHSVFPNVYVLDVPSYGGDLGNSLVIATKQPTALDNFAQNVNQLEHPLLRVVADRSLNAAGARLWELQPGADSLVFTDDKAPVEQVIHSLIVRYLTGG